MLHTHPPRSDHCIGYHCRGETQSGQRQDRRNGQTHSANRAHGRLPRRPTERPTRRRLWKDEAMRATKQPLTLQELYAAFIRAIIASVFLVVLVLISYSRLAALLCLGFTVITIIGGACNLLCISANAGRMPVRWGPQHYLYPYLSRCLSRSKTHAEMAHGTRLWFLADILGPTWAGARFSLGDVFITIGAVGASVVAVLGALGTLGVLRLL
jgi:hypothetical protein